MNNADYTAYLFTFEINNSFESFDRYAPAPSDELRTDFRLYSENKVYFIKLLRSLLGVCGLKEAKDLVECEGQPHLKYRDDDGADWHSFTVRITTVDTAMRIMMFLLKIITAANRYDAMKTEVGQIFTIRNARMKPLHNLEYFTIT